ncbi:MAG: methyltransferase domain-containing protein [Tidjanibacter sp.]|nr:methyltransferase domain-containing protein [Tidjanibacter sp.]
MQTAERVSQTDRSDNFVFARSLKAYREAAKRVGGKVLEIGTGSGYGIDIIAPSAESFTTIDKHRPAQQLLDLHPEIEFRQMTVPPLAGFDDGSVDWVVSFQVIEHIADDHAFVDEIWRVLRNGGGLILTTPNRPMSLTRNPWHQREYTADELSDLLGGRFQSIEQLGVGGNERVAQYYGQNRLSVARFARWDVFDLQHRMPSWLLRLPYDVLNRWNRRRLLNQNQALTESFTADDYRLSNDTDNCYDLYFVAQKKPTK